MSDFLKNPLSLFDIKGKTAIITGASGAFGALAARTFAGAGANTVLAASKADELKKVAAECEELGGRTEVIALRPSSEENCEKIVKAAVDRFGGVDILVVASGLNKVSKIVDQKVADFLDVMDANVNQSWLMASAAESKCSNRARAEKSFSRRPRVFVGPPSWLHRLLRLQVGGRRHHKGIGLRMGRNRHYGERARPDRVSFAAYGMDV